MKNRNCRVFETSGFLANSAGKVLVFLLALAASATQGAVHYQVVRSFGSSPTDGLYPRAVIRGADGVLYGATYGGGSNNAGTVFKVNNDGTSSALLLNFSTNNADGQYPLVLLQGGDGDLYGATYFGGAYTNSIGIGFGTLFKLSTNGSSYRILHSFGNTGDGRQPTGLIEGSDGTLYGTTQLRVPSGWGTVFKLNIDGTGYSLIHEFSYPGGSPQAGLVQGRDGTLYGTTGGTVFKLNTDGSGYLVLHSFTTNSADGANPSDFHPLLEGSDGALYGTTSGGGSNGAGTAFRLSEDGADFRLLYSFSPWDHVSSAYPNGLVEGADGALYGTTQGGGSAEGGTLFMVQKDGSGYSLLYSFQTSGIAGFSPRALVKGNGNIFYGLTTAGGADAQGTLFRLWPTETPTMAGVSFTSNGVQVGFAGVAGLKYQVSRSSDLTNFTALGTTTMPSSGIYTNRDNTPPNPAAYYRAAWVP